MKICFVVSLFVLFCCWLFGLMLLGHWGWSKVGRSPGSHFGMRRSVPSCKSVINSSIGLHSIDQRCTLTVQGHIEQGSSGEGGGG